MSGATADMLFALVIFGGFIAGIFIYLGALDLVEKASAAYNKARAALRAADGE